MAARIMLLVYVDGYSPVCRFYNSVMRIPRSGILAVLFCVAVPLFAAPADDIAAARAVFDANLNAIRQRNRDAYLGCYLHSDRLVLGGPEGFATGFDSFAKGAGAKWPDLIEASDIHLTPLQPGIVYGTYRYRVRYGSDEHVGISERLFVSTTSGWKIAVTGAIDSPIGTPAPPRALKGATLIDGRGGAPIANANVILRDSKIDCAGSAAQCPVPEGVDVTDVKGMWIAPGLIDAHVHFSQTGWADGRPDSIDVRPTHPYEQVEADLKMNAERFGRSYICSGVTAVYDVGGYAWTLRLHDRFEPNTLVPHVDAAGPLLSTLDHWLNLPAERQFMVLHDDASAREGVRYLASQGAHAVKVWYIVRPPDLTVEASAAAVASAGDEARKHNLPLIVHATGLPEAKASLRGGATLLVHSVWDQAVDQEFLDLAKHTHKGSVVFETIQQLSDDEVIEHLTAVKGIGVWTAHMFLIFALRRTDVLPTGDLGVRMAIRKAYELSELPKPAEIEAIAGAWRPYCSIAAWYLWRSLDNEAAL